MRLAIKPETNKYSCLLKRLNGVIKLIKTARTKIANQNIKITGISKGCLEPVEKCLIPVICKKGKVCLVATH